MAYAEQLELAESRLIETGFVEKQLSDLVLPAIHTIERTDGPIASYQVFGDRENAHTLIFTQRPYSTRLSDPTEAVHLSAQQAVLGNDYCVVGVQAYEPQAGRFSKADRKTIATGSFQPLADRMLTVIEGIHMRDDQDLILHGFSMGADVGVETNFQMLYSPHRGIRRVDRLGVYDPARSTERLGGALGMIAVFAKSGPDLFDNVVASSSPALLEGRNIDPTDPKARKKHDVWVSKNVIRYNLQDPLGNIALMRGFSRATSHAQLNLIATHPDRPQTVVGRTNSNICPPSFTDSLIHHDGLQIEQIAGDHSIDDNVQHSVAFMLRTLTT